MSIFAFTPFSEIISYIDNTVRLFDQILYFILGFCDILNNLLKIAYIKVHSLCCEVIGFQKCTVSCNHCYGIIQNSFTMLKDPLCGWMDKEDVTHTYNGILLRHKKKRNWVICSEVDGPRVCHTEWSKSEREKQILYANIYIWNLKKKKEWSWRT